MNAHKLVVKVEAGVLTLAERFTIARQTWDSVENVFVSVAYGDAVGRGECAPDEHWGETTDSVVGQIKALDLNEVLSGPFDLESLATALPAGAARCALDVALHDLAARLAGISVAELLGLGGRVLPPTSVTVPIAERDVMVERARTYADHPIIKTKVGFDGDVEAVAAIRNVYPGRIRIDANEGWTESEATERLEEFARLHVEFCEQPIKMHDLEALRRIKEASPIPVYADEDVCDSHDVVRLRGCVDGVNLKLRKTGGIREMLKAIGVARAQGMGVMIGCNLESGILATAAASVASLVDHADIDSPLLLSRDPFPGVVYDHGNMTLPDGPGLGVEETSE